MKFLNKSFLITISILLLGAAFLIVQRIRNPVCEAPLMLFDQSRYNHPEAIIGRLVSELGGLPKTDMDVYALQKAVDAGAVPPLYPVDEWAVETFSVANSSFNSLFDDDPTYSHDFSVQVTYMDGDTAVFQWSSWSYGVVACPLAISLGSGPPGQLKIVP